MSLRSVTSAGRSTALLYLLIAQGASAAPDPAPRIPDAPAPQTSAATPAADAAALPVTAAPESEPPTSTPAAVAAPGTIHPAASSSAASEDPAAALAAYHGALRERRLDAHGALGIEQLREVLERAEAQLALGRRDEAIAVLAPLIHSPRFAPLSELPEGRAASFLLGDALGQAGAYRDARRYLERLVQKPQADSWFRRAVGGIVDYGLASGDIEAFLGTLARLPKGGKEPWAGDVAFLRGAWHERSGRPREALAEYLSVQPNARYWSQATYRAGLIEVESGALARGERQFCKIADPKQTPRVAPLFGGNDFFRVRDMARLGLGRIAHEQYRFDDARYYYHLVPGDSDRLPEALYESATSRYEAKDYRAAHDLLNELSALERPHPYRDEAWILDAYVDLAECQFPRADAKLKEFLRRYEPVLEAARQLKSDPVGLRALLEGSDSRLRGLGVAPQVAELLGTSIRVDSSYGRVSRQLADLDRQRSGLSSARLEIEDLRARVAQPDAVKPHLAAAVSDTPVDRLKRLHDQTAAVRRLLREASRAEGAAKTQLAAIKTELVQIEADAGPLAARLLETPGAAGGAPAGDALLELLRVDAALARELEQATEDARALLVQEQGALALEALERVERRLTRLVRRARAGRIETVLGRKRAVELEIEALSQGFLPRGAVDSLDAARYLADDEEYWPFDGEDWEDEYIGGEGLR